jgi:hypothetical protein
MAHNTFALVTKYHTSGLPQKKFCDKHSLALSTLQYHLKKSKEHRNNRPAGFISFPRPVAAANARSTVAIIRGEFTPAQIAQIISSCGGA